MIGRKVWEFTNVTFSLDFTFRGDSRNLFYCGGSSSSKWSPRKKSSFLSYSRNRPRRVSSISSRRRTHGRNGGAQEEEKGVRKVKCEVEVISWRERRVKAEIVANADVDSVWDSLTDYERLADFVPNLVSR